MNAAPRSTNVTVLSWILQVAAALIFLQTLFFKFTGAEESVYIFTKIGAEPFGRYASGVAELVAAVLLLIPQTAVLGAVLGLGVISGAILSHLTILGISVKGDGGVLFGLACAVFVACTGVIVIRRGEIPVIGPRLVASRSTSGGHTP